MAGMHIDSCCTRVLAGAVRVALAAGAFGLAQATTITVTTQDDVVAADANCSLREAIANANSQLQVASDCPPGDGNDLIQFVPGVTSIIITGGELELMDSTITIDGGATGVTISANHQSRIFNVTNASATVTLSHLVLQNGYSLDRGAGLFSYGGVLTLNNSLVIGNIALSGSGAGVWHGGSVTLNSTTVMDNTAGHAGAIVADFLTVNESLITGNRANSLATGGCAIEVSSGVTISNSVISGNGPDPVTLLCHGGGLYLGPSVQNATISGSLFVDNSAGSGGRGGAVFTSIPNDVKIANSTFAGNSAGSGGAIYFSSSPYTSFLFNVTLAGNSAAQGAAIYNGNGNVLNLGNVIVASSSHDNCKGGIVDEGGNIDDGASCGFGIGTSSLSNTNPMLGSLGHYGGPTPSIVPRPGSPAIDAGVDAYCDGALIGDVDQRGVARPQGAHCDSGAAERVAVEDVISLDGFEGY